ncbi:hypothetical protein SAMD00019534_078110 [Acytostelium subglobosum LB1]|uniref:hypothetical protein n=1 Tax=Acytostelium subglobosum LB1 TaxID=1410327 RepID=UPI0006451391|nr:hypothetical protein SAMD00019534_078110 [Acytostelium subglobosum LB1]GAM24636.1 hypothetical protein SAMD00019534_078110 [Acytostelium subglobosum LB1]|eukprot:XP_012752305.1 hypothetical protein SAMD00019534_078110 [Acytostelium subglobosum LB1]
MIERVHAIALELLVEVVGNVGLGVGVQDVVVRTDKVGLACFSLLRLMFPYFSSISLMYAWRADVLSTEISFLTLPILDMLIIEYESCGDDQFQKTAHCRVAARRRACQSSCHITQGDIGQCGTTDKLFYLAVRNLHSIQRHTSVPKLIEMLPELKSHTELVEQTLNLRALRCCIIDISRWLDHFNILMVTVAYDKYILATMTIKLQVLC